MSTFRVRVVEGGRAECGGRGVVMGGNAVR